jgi:hypothetical protein
MNINIILKWLPLFVCIFFIIFFGYCAIKVYLHTKKLKIHFGYKEHSNGKQKFR